MTGMSAALRARAPTHTPLRRSALTEEMGASNLFRPGGPRNPLKTLNSDKGNPGKTKPCSWIAFGPALLDLAGFG
jgi:hypothetical protein